jgi:hypothetical protein
MDWIFVIPVVSIRVSSVARQHPVNPVHPVRILRPLCLFAADFVFRCFISSSGDGQFRALIQGQMEPETRIFRFRFPLFDVGRWMLDVRCSPNLPRPRCRKRTRSFGGDSKSAAIGL